MRLKLIAILALIAGPILAVSGYKDKQSHEKLVAEGVKVEGEITGGESSKRRRSGKTYKFDIAFETKEKRVIKKTLTVPKSFVDSHTSGETITNPKVEVLYLPSDPTQCEVVGVDSDHEAMLYGGTLAGLAGLVGTIVMVRKKRAA